MFLQLLIALLPSGSFDFLARKVLAQPSAVLFKLRQLRVEIVDDLFNLLFFLGYQNIALLSFFSDSLFEISQALLLVLYRNLSVVDGRLKLPNFDLVTFLLLSQEVDLALT